MVAGYGGRVVTTTRAEEIIAALQDMHDVLTGAGEHAAHERRQLGACVYCSCGARVQGVMKQ